MILNNQILINNLLFVFMKIDRPKERCLVKLLNFATRAILENFENSRAINP